jgi:hypothetical protein
LRATTAVQNQLRSQRETFGTVPEVAVDRTPTAGCPRGAPECRWVFSIEDRVNDHHAEMIYYAVDPYDGAVTQGDPENNSWEPLRN